MFARFRNLFSKSKPASAEASAEREDYGNTAHESHSTMLDSSEVRMFVSKRLDTSCEKYAVIAEPKGVEHSPTTAAGNHDIDSKSLENEETKIVCSSDAVLNGGIGKFADKSLERVDKSTLNKIINEICEQAKQYEETFEKLQNVDNLEINTSESPTAYVLTDETKKSQKNRDDGQRRPSLGDNFQQETSKICHEIIEEAIKEIEHSSHSEIATNLESKADRILLLTNHDFEPKVDRNEEEFLENNENALIPSSMVVDDLTTTSASGAATAAAVSDAISPSGDSGNCSNLSSDIGNTSVEVAAATVVIISPTGNNDIACHAISNKLKKIAAVAESLDAAIRDVQNDSEVLEANSSSSEKKLETQRSNSSEDWHSRSTEDESFATASEGNFTPHSHSSSFQTASGRTSSFISSGKNSFDASEADDLTFTFEMNELTSPINMSFDSSDHTSASQSPPNAIGSNGTSAKRAAATLADDQSSIVDVEELHSQSVTPTPNDSHYDRIPVESESELESGITDAPSIEILTDLAAEVSTCPILSEHAQRTNKPNAAWRRSKYYENITKQTIKGFL